MPKKTLVIINPVSAGGKTGRNRKMIIDRINKTLQIPFDVCVTGAPGDAFQAARNAAREETGLIIIAGGDGTIQEVVNGLMHEKTNLVPAIRLGILHCGTGCGFADSIGIPADFTAQLAVIKNGETMAADCGCLKYTHANGHSGIHYFINELQCGIGGTVVKNQSSNGKRFGGFLSFGLTAVKAIFTHPDQWMSVHLDHGQSIEDKFTGILVANGAFTGGGMNLAPGARPDDGLFNVLFIHGQSIRSRLLSFSQIYTGRHINRPHFSYFQTRGLHISASEPVLVEADGELLGTAPLEISLIPAAINICIP